MVQVKSTRTRDRGDVVAIDNIKLTGDANAGSSQPVTPEPPVEPGLPAQPVATLKLNETSGKIAADSSQFGRNNRGRLVSNASWAVELYLSLFCHFRERKTF